MAKKIFELIRAWDGSSGTGREAREIINNNFVKVNDAIEELMGAMQYEHDDFTTLSMPPEDPEIGDEWLVDGILYTWIGEWVEF